MNLLWYTRRLRRMSPREVGLRLRDAGVLAGWWVKRSGRRARIENLLASAPPALLPARTREAVDEEARGKLLAAAESLLEGRWTVFALDLDEFGADWDWFFDPRTGRRAPATGFAPTIDQRDEESVGNVKYVWELSRHHHLTVLAAAWFLSGDDRYAVRVREHLWSWWQVNPFLQGIHWTSGIEIGMRLIAWTWIRRLLNEWRGVSELFDTNPSFLRQLVDHQRYLARLRSHGSSGNNHLIAELAGLFVSTCAFSVSPHATRWRDLAAHGLREELRRQTFPDGTNRELATDYHGFVLELGLVAALEGEASGHPLGEDVWVVLRSMMDLLAAVVDERNRPPRQGDGDNAHGLLLDPPGADRWSDLLSTGRRLFGPLAWWPEIRSSSVRAPLWTALASIPTLPGNRSHAHPSLFPDAGMAILRSHQAHEEVWCRCDHGPLGFLSTAAHGHADALSVEVRVGGVDVLADPGTYCYHGEPEWRTYFRSTRAHNTLEIQGHDQAVPGGPFLWLDHPRAWLIQATGLENGALASWRAAHDGYSCLDDPALHERMVELDRESRTLSFRDVLHGDVRLSARLMFHFGPAVEVSLAESRAELSWSGPCGPRRAFLDLSPELRWRLARGETNPPLGWYSHGFDRKRPAFALIGEGSIPPDQELVSRLHLATGPEGDTMDG